MTAAVVQQTPNSPPSVSLIAAALAVQEVDERWVNGIRYQPESCGAADVFDICNNNDPNSGFSKTVANNTTPITGTSLGIVAQDTCSTWGWQVADHQARATRLLLSVESFKIARELWEGNTGLNPYLMRADLTSTVNINVNPLDAVGQLERAFYNTSPAPRAMVHMSPRFLELLMGISGGQALRREGNVYYTWMDSVVAVDKGYQGKGPGGVGGEWAYITPIVTIRRGKVDVIPDTMAEATSRKDNKVTFFAERPFSATWNYNCPSYTLSVDVTGR
jgi:hypothetical protein